MILTSIPASDLHKHWEWIRPRLEVVNRRGGGHDTCEEIYVQLRSEQSHLMMIEDFGFVILQKHRDPDGSVMFVHKLFAEPNIGMPKIDAVMDALDAVARSAGCVRIRSQSKRKGCDYGGRFKATATVYEREL